MDLKPVKIGFIGCGNISGAYLKNAKRFPILDVAAVADIDKDRAKAKAAEFGVPSACGVRQLLNRDDIEIVVNLTTPQAHAKVNAAILKAGKHAYCEKPLAVTRAEGKRTLALAAEKNLRVGCAPDTVLGAGHQTARKLLDEGAIGRPVAAMAFMTCPGHESWHPDPEFYYKVGGGPMMDMGPYYLSDLTMLLGPIARVSGSAKILINPRTITSKAKFGQKIDVETPDHVAGTMDFACGAIGTIVMTFAVRGAQLPRIEIYGTEGTLSVPDPNGFGGPVKLLKAGSREWTEVPLTHIYVENSRSIGVADMAYAIRSGRAHRITGQQAYHVLDVMHGFLDSSNKGKHYAVPSTFDRPAALPVGLAEGQLDA
jgi:predicted dehydrogenase